MTEVPGLIVNILSDMTQEEVAYTNDFHKEMGLLMERYSDIRLEATEVICSSYDDYVEYGTAVEIVNAAYHNRLEQERLRREAFYADGRTVDNSQALIEAKLEVPNKYGLTLESLNSLKVIDHKRMTEVTREFGVERRVDIELAYNNRAVFYYKDTYDFLSYSCIKLSDTFEIYDAHSSLFAIECSKKVLEVVNRWLDEGLVEVDKPNRYKHLIYVGADLVGIKTTRAKQDVKSIVSGQSHHGDLHGLGSALICSNRVDVEFLDGDYFIVKEGLSRQYDKNMTVIPAGAYYVYEVERLPTNNTIITQFELIDLKSISKITFNRE